MAETERRFQPGASISTIFFNEQGKAQVRTEARSALAAAEQQLVDSRGVTLPDHLYASQEARISPTAVARELGINKKTLARVYDLLGIPKLSAGEYLSAKWEQDSSFRGAITEAKRAEMLQRWQDPEYRAHIESTSRDPKNIEARNEGTRRALPKRWEDPAWRARMQRVQEERWAREGERERMSAQSTANWEDPEFRANQEAIRQSEDYRRRLGQSIRRKYDTDPDYRARVAQNQRTPEAIERKRAEMLRRWENPEFRARMSEAARKQIAAQRQDPAYVELMKGVVSNMMRERWQTQSFRERMQARSRELWQDPDHREYMSEMSRELWLDVDRRIQMSQGLRSVHGERKDLEFYALSTYEANFARVLILTERDFYTREIFTLQVEPEFEEYFSGSQTSMAVDFVTQNRNGHVRLYEIMAHPYEDPIGWAKLTMLLKQYPDLDIRTITPDVYEELTQVFAGQINVSLEFTGWETTEDNVYTNPQKYAPVQ